eukprot:Sspe_Gene.29087::Locus_13598_Transcript_2_2_Confidence_0.600_Length_1486::g.29087::m.29087
MVSTNLKSSSSGRLRRQNSRWHVYRGSVFRSTACPYPGTTRFELSSSQMRSVSIFSRLLLRLRPAPRLDLPLQVAQEQQHLLVRQPVQRPRQPVHPRAHRPGTGRSARSPTASSCAPTRSPPRGPCGSTGTTACSPRSPGCRTPAAARSSPTCPGSRRSRPPGCPPVERPAGRSPRHRRQPRDQVQRVLQRVLPVVRLVRLPARVRLRELALLPQRQDRDRELQHRVHVPRQRVQRLRHLPHDRVLAPVVELLDDLLHLLLRRHVPRQQQPPHSASGYGSCPLGALFGSCFWHSGMLSPRNRIPSCASSSDGSYVSPVIPRIPPYAAPTVASPSDLSPCSFFSLFTIAACSGIFFCRIARSSSDAPLYARAPTRIPTDPTDRRIAIIFLPRVV